LKASISSLAKFLSSSEKWESAWLSSATFFSFFISLSSASFSAIVELSSSTLEFTSSSFFSISAFASLHFLFNSSISLSFSSIVEQSSVILEFNSVTFVSREETCSFTSAFLVSLKAVIISAFKSERALFNSSFISTSSKLFLNWLSSINIADGSEGFMDRMQYPL